MTKKQNRHRVIRKIRAKLKRSLATVTGLSSSKMIRSGYGTGINSRSIEKDDGN